MASPRPPRRCCLSRRPLLCQATTTAALALLASPLVAGATADGKAPETNGRTVTSWIPVTTAHPSQPGCNDMYWSYVPNTIAAWDPGYGISVADASCHPRPVTTWWDADRLGRNTLTTLSLGPVTCPQAYTTAHTSVKDAESTFVACCPSGYTFFDILEAGDTGECWSSVTAGKAITYAIRDSAAVWRTSTTTLTAPTTVAGIQVNGWIFADATGTAAGSYSSSTSSSSSSDLSPGAKAAIAVGATLGAIGLATLLAGIWMLRRARRSPPHAHVPDASSAAAYPHHPNNHPNNHPNKREEDTVRLQPQPQPAHPPHHHPDVPAELFSASALPPPPRIPSPRLWPWYWHPMGNNPSPPPSPQWCADARPSHPGGGGRSHSGGSAATISSAHGGGGGGGGEVAGGEPQPQMGTGTGQGQGSPAGALELVGVTSPVLHPGDLQPQGVGPGAWKPGAVYR